MASLDLCGGNQVITGEFLRLHGTCDTSQWLSPTANFSWELLLIYRVVASKCLYQLYVVIKKIIIKDKYQITKTILFMTLFLYVLDDIHIYDPDDYINGLYSF